VRSLRRQGGKDPGSGREGFSLLEVVVALAILAVGMRLSEGARDVSAAQVYASQRMEEALLSPNPVPGVEQGSFGEKYRWEARTTQELPEEDSPFREVRIRVIVSWGDGARERAVELVASRWERKGQDEKG